MADDFHGNEEQAFFEKTMKMVFPERPIVDIPNNDPIFHTVFDLDDRYRITGMEHLEPVTRRTARWPAGRAFTTITAELWWRFR